MIFNLLIIAAAVAGFLIARYIYLHKRRPERQPLVCPLNFDCDPVIHSQYSRFLGLATEVLGMLYYGLVAIVYGAVVFQSALITPLIIWLIAKLTIVASLFSLYLIFIQAFKLRQWCSWCLISAALSLIIFLIVTIP